MSRMTSRAPHPRPVAERRRHGDPEDGTAEPVDDVASYRASARRRPLGVGRHHALVSGAARAGRAGRALPRPPSQPPHPAELGPHRRLRAGDGAAECLGWALPPRARAGWPVRRSPNPSSWMWWGSSRRSKTRSPPPSDPGRIGRLIAAESAGALVAAELTFAGLPWRADVHDRVLTELLGRATAARRTSRAASPSSPISLRELLGTPDLNPDSPARSAEGARERGPAGLEHRAVGAPQDRPPGRSHRCWSTRSWRGC